MVTAFDVDIVHYAGLGFRTEPRLPFRFLHSKRFCATSATTGQNPAAVAASVYLRACPCSYGFFLLAPASLDAQCSQLLR